MVESLSGIHQCLPGVPLLKMCVFSDSAGPLFHFPGGMTISNREPIPGTPVSFMVIPVIARTSRTRNRPRPDDFAEPDDVVNPRSKISSFLSCGMPTPSSS